MFSLVGGPGNSLAGVGPDEVDDLPFNADETTLGGIRLTVGQSFSYLFDFGDQWQFNLEVLDYLPDEPNVNPTLVACEGSPPPQYPTWDDDDDGDETE
ncbi:MAG: hypothetical protein C7B45_11215 [Sulfobacillus acidophilus]|uniref:Plasmid pRiA4b Orf3-like domain-containing protein n=1 Tax=Sulfobacillus acidophilus TaxID=53633 RepID=A0A2T2WGI4_9FIRM|nr:MAG: hypothetical protein C7B45_11215 [Sulfobacillus acidophilus]